MNALQEPMLSGVIPVYNVEKWMELCVYSILCCQNQSFEVILVDDGSTNYSAAFCNRIVRRDDRIKVIHQTNMGVSSARNVGMKAARGLFIWFVDSDDLVALGG